MEPTATREPVWPPRAGAVPCKEIVFEDVRGHRAAMVELADRIPGTSAARYMGRDVHKEWTGPVPTDPLELCLEYKLGFDDVSDLAEKTCVVTFDERKKLTVEDARVFAQALIDQGPTKIEYLFLAGNEFGDEGLAAIAKAMEDGALPKLLTVDLSRNKATDVGFASFVNAIKHCRQFRDVIFAENTLGDDGFAALHQVMLRDEWPNIERLNLAGAQSARHAISDAAFASFADDLANGQIKALRLEELEMSGTPHALPRPMRTDAAQMSPA